MAKDLKPIYTAVNADQAETRLEEFADKWQGKYPAAVKLWRNAWNEFIPFLDYDVEIRKIICTTDEIVNPLLGRAESVYVGAVFPPFAAAA
jgi:transposase-like protein